ncbi:MAG TPA: hypothetical protein VNZ85_03240 [Caulobacter sp.]|nr:hypothetical protein [Caulobacter sp.]
MKVSPLAALAAVLVATLPIGSGANASVSTSAKIYYVTVTPSGVAYFFQDGANRTGVPACAANFPTRWAFSTQTSAGQAVLATVLSAYATGKPLIVAGNSTCDVVGDTESISYLYIDSH